MTAHKIEMPDGRYVLPVMTDPVLKANSKDDRFLVFEFTPIMESAPNPKALCQLPIRRVDALRLAKLILALAADRGWALPEEPPEKSTIQ